MSNLPLRKHVAGKTVQRTFHILEAIDLRLRKHPEINWSAVAREAIIKALAELEKR